MGNGRRVAGWGRGGGGAGGGGGAAGGGGWGRRRPRPGPRARIDRVHYWRIEHGRCDPTPRVAARIEAALRGSVEWARVADHGPAWQRGMRGVLRREEAPLPWMERDAWVCLDLVGPGPAGRYWFPAGDVAIE